MISKFRAWDNNRKLMIDEVVVIDLYNECIGYLYRSEIVQGEIVSRLPINDVIIMQSTGLFDKNGKEIYEGDIVKGYSVYPEPSIFEPFLMGEVYYTNRGTWDSYSYILGGFNEQVEVIGNIYENKELIEVECN